MTLVNDRSGDDPPDPMVHYRAMQQLTQRGDYAAALEYAGHLAPLPGSFLAFYTGYFSGHAKLALAIGHDQILEAARERERSPKWLRPDRLFSHLQAAIRSRTPLSLVRHGDGEGKFLAHQMAWARRLITDREADCVLGFNWEIWFGQPLSTVDPADLRDLGNAFVTAMAETDVLGVTPAARYEDMIYRRGFLGVLEHAIADAVARQPGILLTSAMAHTQLHGLSPYMQALLSGIDFLGVISPHPGLAMRLAELHGITEFEEYVVPGESRLPSAARGRTQGAHFPDRFRAIMRDLRVPRDGAVFLVAAGLLGKIYCHRIRERGGIAIDVGSLVDAWMGFDSRPMQRVRRGWTLPGIDTPHDGAPPVSGTSIETAQKRFWHNGHHVWLDAASPGDGPPPDGFIGPLLE
jgi:hypothetical protein